jgi:hypothetical protein
MGDSKQKQNRKILFLRPSISAAGLGRAIHPAQKTPYPMSKRAVTSDLPLKRRSILYSKAPTTAETPTPKAMKARISSQKYMLIM